MIQPVFVISLICGLLFLQCNNNKTDQTAKNEERGLGLKFDREEVYLGVKEAELPSGAGEDVPVLMDLSVDMPEIGDQGPQQSCVAWATSYALKSFTEKKKGNSYLLFSPSFVYNQINNGKDEGSYFQDALNVLSQQGTVLLQDMPYDPTNYTKKPSEDLKQKAKPYSILKWYRITTQNSKEVKIHVSRGIPVIFGAYVDQGFKEAKRNLSDEYFWKEESGRSLGSHAMVVVGYDDSKNAFKVMNSWGKNWANNGYCWIDYQFFEKKAEQGYVVFDPAKPDNAVVNTRPNNNTNDRPIDNRPLDNTFTNPTEFSKANLRGVQVQHNVMDNTYGYCMKVSGYIDIPAGFGKTFQISNHFYLSNSTIQAKSLMPPTFADVNGFAATGSILYSVPDNGLKNYYWECLMPYKALELPYEISYFYFVPTLFIDNFGYAKGEAVNFSVNKKFLQ